MPLFTLLSPSTLSTITGTVITYTQHPVNKTITADNGYKSTPTWPATTAFAIRIRFADTEYNDGLYAGFPSGDTGKTLVFDLAPETQSHFIRLVNLLHSRHEAAHSQDDETKAPTEMVLSVPLQAADDKMLAETGISAVKDRFLRQVLLAIALRGAGLDPGAYDDVVEFLASAGQPPRALLSYDMDETRVSFPQGVQIALVKNKWWTPERHHVHWIRTLWDKNDAEEHEWRGLFDAMAEAGWFQDVRWRHVRQEARRRVLDRVAMVGSVGLMGHVLGVLKLEELDAGFQCDLLGSAVYNGVEMMGFLLDRGLDPDLVDDRASNFRGGGLRRRYMPRLGLGRWMR
ncbi:hypothetical protein OQA88_9994 [Cercophora sp. LCS_1]